MRQALIGATAVGAGSVMVPAVLLALLTAATQMRHATLRGPLPETAILWAHAAFDIAIWTAVAAGISVLCFVVLPKGMLWIFVRAVKRLTGSD